MIDFKRACILIVDDQEPNVYLLKRILEIEGYNNLISTTDAREVVTLYQTHQPDIVLLDLNMPYLDGLAVIEQLKLLPSILPPNILMITAQTETTIRVKALQNGAKDFVSKPFDRQEVISRIRNLLENHLLQKALLFQNDHLESLVVERTAQLVETQKEAINTLGKAAEYRDNETGFHVIRVGHMTRLLAAVAGLDEKTQEMLLLAAPMHDIGKIGIPDAILLKPGKLSDAEFLIMQSHAVIGAHILSELKSPIMALASEIALTHHEKWDGSGYPNQLKGEAIPLSGRLVAIADVFDALTSERPYKTPWPLADVQNFFKQHAGTHFDPNLIPLVLANWEELVAIKTSFADVKHDVRDPLERT